MRAMILSLLLLAGCVSASQMVAPEVAESIPPNAEVIRVYSTLPASDLYTTLYRSLALEGYEITSSNDQMRTLSTGYRDIGQYTTLKVNALVEQAESGSVAVLRGMWGVTGSFASGLSAATGASVGADVGEPARWTKNNRAGVAFGVLATFAESLPHERIEYAN